MNKVALAVVAPLLCAAPSFAHAGKAPRQKAAHASPASKAPGIVASASEVSGANEEHPPEGAVADGAVPAATTSAQPQSSTPVASVPDAWSPRKPPPKLKIPEWLGRAAVGVSGGGTAVAGKGKALTSEQQKLADLYGGEADRTNVDKIPGAHGESKHEQVSDAAVMATVTRNKKSIQPCYERALKHDDSMQRLRVDITIKVGISGSVTAVTYSERRVADSELGKCLTQTIRRWHFPSQDSEYETQFPLLLQAQ